MKELKEKDEILKLMKSKSPVAIFFYAEWCGHCQNMQSAWDTLELDKKDVTFYKMESENIPDELSVNGFPHFVFVKDGKTAKTIDGERGESDDNEDVEAKKRADLLKKELFVSGKRRVHSRRRLHTRRLRRRSVRKARK